ncbi:hypothetical protein Leryth_000191 [Lithospermum erythrorhizon]|nr:hypothetical protein Leryth_000191 [Lithospermum erythrorhizon]
MMSSLCALFSAYSICSVAAGVAGNIFAFGLFLSPISLPLEEYYRSRGKLLEFDLPGGIPESWPKLLHALNLDDPKNKESAAA